MSRCMSYKISTNSPDAYVISNCLYYKQDELTERMIGNVKYSSIDLANVGGTTLEDVSNSIIVLKMN